MNTQNKAEAYREYVCEYANDGKRITSPGKFEGEPIFAPDYWNLGLEGFSDSDDGTVYKFKLGPKDFATHPTLKEWMGGKRLGRRRLLRLWETSAGFVQCF